MAEKSKGNNHGRVLLGHCLPDTLEKMKKSLSGLNLSFSTATDGEDALKIASEKKLILAILDAQMPRLNGFEICRKLKEEKGSKGPKVFLIVDRKDLHGREKAFLAGCDGIISGPPDDKRLLSRIMDLFSSKAPLSRVTDAVEGEDSSGASSSDSLDKKTGLFKEAFFLERAEEEFKRAKRHQRALTLLIAAFASGKKGKASKKEIPSALIQEIAGKCLLDFRSEDILGISADKKQFLFLFPETPPGEIENLGKKLAALKEDLEEGDSLSLKWGAAVYPRPEVESFPDLLRLCENHLEEAKKGKGDCFSFPDPPDSRRAGDGDHADLPLPPGEEESPLLQESLRLREILCRHDPSRRTRLELMEQWAPLLGNAAGFSQKDCEKLIAACRVFDLGFIAISPHLLKKPVLSEEEFGEIKRHVSLSITMASAFLKDRGVETIVRFHHENYDGTGYPLGLRGGEIPPFSQMIHLLSFYSSLLEGTAYRPPLPGRAAAGVLQGKAFTLFDPKLVALFLSLLDAPRQEKGEHENRPQLVLLDGIGHKTGGEVYFNPASKAFLYYAPPLKNVEELSSLILTGKGGLKETEMAAKINQAKDGPEEEYTGTHLSAEETALLLAALKCRAVPAGDGFLLKRKA